MHCQMISQAVSGAVLLLRTFSREARDLETPGWLMLRADPAARQLPDLATKLNTTSWDSVKGTWVEASSTYCLGPLPLCSAHSPVNVRLCS